MAAVTVRNIPESTHRALRERATRHGRSTEAEIRDILEQAVRPEDRVRVGTELADLGRECGGGDLDIRRDDAPIESATFD